VNDYPMRTVRLGNDDFHIVINLDLGCEITYLGTKTRNVLARYDWAAPVPASLSTSYGDHAFDWLSEYRGGWQTLLPNAGDPCTVNGVPLPFHGEWSRTRVVVDYEDQCRISVRSGLRLPLVGQRSIDVQPTNRSVTIRQSITNIGGSATPFVWGEHPAFALSPNSRLHIPATTVRSSAVSVGTRQDVLVDAAGFWPMMPGLHDADVNVSIVPAEPAERLCYLPDVDGGWAVLQDSDISIALSWDVAAFPHIWLWQEIGGEGFPWFGRSAITAIEPQSSWPASGLAAAIESGQAQWLDPRASAEAWITVALVDTLTGTPRSVDQAGVIDYEEARHA
jgi:galactose mutarotase-like enzyme